MGRGAGAAVAFIIGTVEISDLRVPLIEMKMQVVSAIGTDQQTGKYILFALVGAALADFPPFLLNLLPHGAVNDRLMDIFENHPIFTIVFDPLLIFVRLGVGLEIEDSPFPRVLPGLLHRRGAVSLPKGISPLDLVQFF